MDFVSILYTFFIGWFIIHMISTKWADGDEKKENIALFINVFWILGGTLFVLISSGAF
jgi:hypothetical protein